MEEKIKDVLAAYPFCVRRVSRGRGAFICDTDQGLKLVKAYHRSPQRLEFEQLVKYTIRDRGYYYVDQFVANQEGQYLNMNADGWQYVVRDWFDGRECEVHNAADVLAAARQLAGLHLLLIDADHSEERLRRFTFDDTRAAFLKRQKELKAIHSYIRRKKQWNDFEKLFMRIFDVNIDAAKEAIAMLDTLPYDAMRQLAIEKKTLCHGDFNYHQVILNRQFTAVVNFDKMHLDIQIKDLYQFLRKVMEKNNWDTSLGWMIIDTYTSVKTISHDEAGYLYALLLFPEKFWKIANHYYNARKSWVSKVNYEKLCQYVKSASCRDAFLKSCKYTFIF